MPIKRNNAYHKGRVNEEIARELTDILRSVKDPRVSGAFISILRVDTANDLKQSIVHYSLLGGDEKETAKGLRSASGFIRKELAARLNLRATPELVFMADKSIQHGANISKILRELGEEASKAQASDSDESQKENEQE